MSDDVLITPASRKIEFKDNSGNVDGKIELDANGNLNITSPGGDIGLGDATADVYIGDGTNNVDIVFEQNGEIRALTGRTLTLGQSDSNVTVTAQNFAVTDGMTLDGGNLILGDDAYSVSSNYVGMKTSNHTGSHDYMIISGVSDGSTYVSAKDGSTVQIRGGGNSSAAIVSVNHTLGTTITGSLNLNDALKEASYECTGSVLDPSNGTLQYKTLSANTTFTESFVDGESITLMIDDGSSYTVTWPTMTWASGSAPTLATSGYTTVVLWHRGSLYGAVVS